ncbi:hypothetical protein LTR08_002844 [Meristemomyces frigidus]|nr:hypothetical protein LTR08_002844 [Meristemomyces frigidus]
MFRNRQSRKPNDDLYKHFKANFPRFGQASSAPALGTNSLTDALDEVTSRPTEAQQQDNKDADPTPRGSDEPWDFGSSGLTPSTMDPNHFSMFANSMPDYYTPTPGGTNAFYHPQAGDLHSPGYGVGLGTPLSLPTSEGTLHASQQAAAFQNFQAHLPQHMQQSSFQHVDPFHMQQQQGFAPHHFQHHPSYEPLEGPIGESPMDDIGMDVGLHHHHHSPELLFHQTQSMSASMQPPPMHPSGDKFRYHVTLNAPTAMIKQSDEIPVTYLNKGQAYTLNVVDTHIQQSSVHVQYRTFVRVSFEDEQQRAKPAACWQLWKEGRGTNEAHQRGGRLQAVEYVESGQLGNAEDPSKPRIELESASFDGFCVIWSPPAGASECPISVRFNFLSTDFSHSKGVKGIPVRLCAKTEILGELSPGSAQVHGPEVCYGKVKLFRDHGAERKLSNDVAHVKKTIDKLNQQISQMESGMGDLGKRKRVAPSKNSGDDRPGKVLKHRRTWSMASVTSSGGRGSAEEDLHVKQMTLQDMFTSTRPASVLYLRGDDSDDMDLYPVKISGEPISLVRVDTNESSTWERQSTETGPPSTLVSPSPSHNSLAGCRRDSNLQQPTPLASSSRVNSSEWRSNPQLATADIQPALPVHPQQLSCPPENQAVKIQTRSPNGAMSGWIEAQGVDLNYQPPPEHPVKPVACFYVQPRIAGQSPTNSYYRAIYLTQRTLRDFNRILATKCNIEPTQILRTIRITRQGLHILLDDECIRALPEGQDMTAEFSEIVPDSPSKPDTKPEKEWETGRLAVICDGEIPTIENINSSGYELKLLF